MENCSWCTWEGGLLRFRRALVQHRVAILTLVSRHDFASQLVRQGLHPIADAQDRQSARGGFQDPTWHQRGAGIVYAGWTARQDDPFGIDVLNRFPGGICWHDLGVNLELPNSAGDQVAVLRAKIDNYDTFGNGFRPSIRRKSFTF